MDIILFSKRLKLELSRKLLRVQTIANSIVGIEKLVKFSSVVVLNIKV